MSDFTFDYFIIGVGPAGQKVAEAAAKAGHRVGVADYQPYGGTCPHRGCDPKKVLYAAAETMNAVERMKGKGFNARPPFSWSDLQAFKDGFVGKIDPGTRERFAKLGISCYNEKARFTAPNELQLGDEKISAGKVVIATGAKPTPLDFPGADLLLTSDEFLHMDELPESMIIVGGGYIGCEFAHIATALGSKVTVIANDENPVAQFDRDLNTLMARAARERGMELHFSSKATKVEENGDGGLTVTVEHKDGSKCTVSAACAFHCAGRVPNIEDLDLEAANIKYGKKGIAIDSKLCTSVSAHYAIGDCADAGLPLTPVANHDAKTLIARIIDGEDVKTEYYPIPTLAFTLPPIASVGMTAEEADKSDKNLEVIYEETTEDFHTRHANGIVSGRKIIIDKDEDVIVGAHLYGPGVNEMINLFALAIYSKTTTAELKRRLWAYPTGGGGIGGMLG